MLKRKSIRATLRSWRKDCRGVAGVEFALIGGFLCLAVVNVADISIYLYKRMNVENAALVGAMSALKACDTTELPATVNCPGLTAAVTAAIQSTSLGSAVTLSSAVSARLLLRQRVERPAIRVQRGQQTGRTARRRACRPCSRPTTSELPSPSPMRRSSRGSRSPACFPPRSPRRPGAHAMTAPRRALAGLWRDEAGAAAVEFALVAPAAIMLLAGIVSLSLLLLSVGSMHYAVEAAARCVSAMPTVCSSSSATVAYANTRYSGARSRPLSRTSPPPAKTGRMRRRPLPSTSACSAVRAPFGDQLLSLGAYSRPHGPLGDLPPLPVARPPQLYSGRYRGCSDHFAYAPIEAQIVRSNGRNRIDGGYSLRSYRLE